MTSSIRPTDAARSVRSRIATPLAILAATSLALAGCGDTEGENDDPGTTLAPGDSEDDGDDADSDNVDDANDGDSEDDGDDSDNDQDNDDADDGDADDGDS